jgi:hypothetical protein
MGDPTRSGWNGCTCAWRKAKRQPPADTAVIAFGSLKPITLISNLQKDSDPTLAHPGGENYMNEITS